MAEATKRVGDSPDRRTVPALRLGSRILAICAKDVTQELRRRVAEAEEAGDAAAEKLTGLDAEVEEAEAGVAEARAEVEEAEQSLRE